MQTQKGYKTKQRAIIEQAMLEQNGKHFTVDIILDNLRRKGEAVGRTTVWRSLERLSDEGVIRKYVQAGESTCYQCVSDEGGCHEHFHLKCEECGKLIHMECDMLSRIGSHIEAEHGFKVNPLKTVLYGKCCECAKR